MIDYDEARFRDPLGTTTPIEQGTEGSAFGLFAQRDLPLRADQADRQHRDGRTDDLAIASNKAHLRQLLAQRIALGLVFFLAERLFVGAPG